MEDHEMKLSELAKKANRLPDIEFQWTGAEQWHDEVFRTNVSSLPQAIDYINELRKRMAIQSYAIASLMDAYKKMKDVLLEADVES
jgi:hypothetical protein